MPLLADRVQETTSTTGTGSLTLSGAVTGYVSFDSVFSDGDIVWYCIDDTLGNWEIGEGTLSGTTLSRSVFRSSNSDALVDFGVGSKRVFCTAPYTYLLPDQTGNDTKFLTTDGSIPSWSTVNFTQDALGAVTRTVQNKLTDIVSVKDFGATGDGVTDDTAAIQDAVDYWMGNRCDLQFPPGNYIITSGIVANFSTTSTEKRHIYGYGALINAGAVAGDAFTVTVSGALTLVRNIFIEGIQISASATGAALTMQGPLAGDSFLYNNVIRDCSLSGKTGLNLLGNFFESSVENCHISAGSTGYGIYIDTSGGSGSGSGGVISSLTLYQNTTRGGINGVYVSVTSNDVNIINGTYLSAQQYGIANYNAQGGYIQGAHVEANWVSNPVATSGQAGVYAVITGTFAIKNIFASCSQGQTHAARVYVGGAGCALLDSGMQYNGLEQFYIWGASGSKAILSGAGTYTTPGTIAITRVTGDRVYSPIVAKTLTKLSNPTSVTPSATANVYHIVLSSNTPTINAPSFTPAVGDELYFSFEQGGGGGQTVTWDSVYLKGSFVPTAVYSSISSIAFRYIASFASGNRWVVINTGTT